MCNCSLGDKQISHHWEGDWSKMCSLVESVTALPSEIKLWGSGTYLLGVFFLTSSDP